MGSCVRCLAKGFAMSSRVAERNRVVQIAGASGIDARKDWELLLAFLPRDYEELALTHRQLEGSSSTGHAKIRTADELLRFIFVHAGAGLALRQTVAVVAESGGPDLSPMRLHMRLRRAAPFLQALVARMVATVAVATPEWWRGYDPIAVDATTVCGPGAIGTDARLHTALRLTSLELLHAEVTDSSEGESLKRFEWRPGQLAIGDRGYANAPGIASVVDAHADVLIRVNRGTLPMYEGETAVEAIDVLERLRALRGHRVSEWRVEIRVRQDDDRKIPGRLMAVRLPEKEAEEARQRVREEHGREVTPDQLEAAGYVALFTTLSKRSFPAGTCLEMYRLRWQIELQFKRWKSICGMDRLPNYRDDTIRSWLYAKVLLGLILDRMGSVESTPAPDVPKEKADSLVGYGAREPSVPVRPMARQAWKLTTILWPALVAAILPVGLKVLLEKLGGIVRRLDSYGSPRVVPRFRQHLSALCDDPGD